MRRQITKIIDAASVDTTTGGIDILGASKVTLFCKRASHTSGNTVFSATVGVGADSIAYNKFISNVTNTNAQMPTRVASLTLSSATQGFLTMSPEDVFENIRVTADVTTDGVNTVWLIAEFDD
jgi:hypothetical protein